MQAAIAIVLFLNGVQVDLPAPAQVIDQIACVPARAVCERVGASVQWQADRRRLVVRSRNAEHGFRLVESLSGDDGLSAVNAQGVIYVSARALAACLGGSCRWSPGTRAVNLRLPWSAPPLAATVGALSDQPLAWLGSLVAVPGRIAGTAAMPGEHPQTDLGAWLLRSAGTISCDSQEFKALAPSPPPFSALGSPVTVVGYLGLDDAGGPLLKPLSVVPGPETPVGGARLRVDRLEVDRRGASVLTARAVIRPGAQGIDTQ